VAGGLYLGRLVNPETLQEEAHPYLLDPDDLTTHGVIIGMTGSGKTGAAMVLIEELLLHGVPVIIIDPKGDAVNIALRFPNLTPGEFAEWIDPIQAKREGLKIEEYAAKIAELWRKGIESYDQSIEKIRRLDESSEVLILTPGSDVGTPVSVLHDLNMPEDLSWESHEDILLEKIKNIVSALLQLAGLESDPIKSNEHVLLSHIIEYCWRNGETLDFSKLLAYILDPPFGNIGAIEVDFFLPEKDRRNLVIALNRVIAAPSFRNWLSGIHMNFDELLWTRNGKPRVVVFYLAHLDEAQRMFAVTLILQNLYGWMFKQPGTTKLKTLLYFDEVYGYIPPYPKNPPSKHLLMLLLKQARAFGLGVILSTQNPVDLDYKALSNTGVWMIGRLQTENDKARVMEGLKLATTTAGASIETKRISQIISSLGKRIFLVHNVHENKQILFKTRWALSYLRGPLTLREIRKLVERYEGKIRIHKKPSEYKVVIEKNILALPPTTADSLVNYFLPARFNIKIDGIKAYYPVLMAETRIFISRSKPPVNHATNLRLISEVKENLTFEDFTKNSIFGLEIKDIDSKDFASSWLKEFKFVDIPDSYAKARFVKKIFRIIRDFVLTNYKITVWSYEGLKIYSQPGESLYSFLAKVRKKLEETEEKEYEKKRLWYDKKIANLMKKIDSKRASLKVLKTDIAELKKQLTMRGASIAHSIFSRRSPLTKLATFERIRERIRVKEEKARQLEKDIIELESELKILLQKMDQELKEIIRKYEPDSNKAIKIEVKPRKREVEISTIAILWMPVILDREKLLPLANLYTGRILSR